MKKIISLVLATALLALSLFAFAGCGKDDNVLVCGVTDIPGLNEQDENGNWIGFESEFAMEVAKLLGMEVEFQIISWGEKYVELNSGKIDCIWNGFTANAKEKDGTDRKDLVEKYFTKSTFEKTDFSKMLNEFNHVEVILKDSNGLASFNRKQIKLITDFANRKNFFTTPVDENTIEKFFNCTLKKTLIATNLRYILQLLYSLSQQKMIPYNWVSLVVRNKMLAPQKSMIPSTRGAISSRLTELKNTTATFPEEEYVNIVKQLKEMY